ncbi:MAG: helix-turn-helix transcriptional regulator [Bacteroidales bacterium]|nr:helix-turn-helix transcriptional regulator [Bacteroidales bacterium]
MAKNNHLSTPLARLDSLLKEQADESAQVTPMYIYDYARGVASVENAVVVVSDMAGRSSRIFCGGFADVLGIGNYNEENSIWEKRILDMMTDEERDSKIVSELRFFNFTRRLPKRRRSEYFLKSKLRFGIAKRRNIDVLHRMYYIYGADGDSIAYTLCIYEPLSADFKGKSVVVNSLTGAWEELDSGRDSNILTQRECQILSLVDSGMKSKDIADELNISTHTVSRHRQEILTKLQVKNSLEACRRARSLRLI